MSRFRARTTPTGADWSAPPRPHYASYGAVTVGVAIFVVEDVARDAAQLADFGLVPRYAAALLDLGQQAECSVRLSERSVGLGQR